MPKGKGYTAKQIQAMRDEGVLSPSEIANIERSAPDTNYFSRIGTIVSLTPKKQGAKAGTRRSRSQGYKYFPDN